ncbi:hypothetical protein RSSM_01034, partial [Rhodopirellula sallentina SM41]
MAKLSDVGTLTIERLIWQTKQLMYDVQVPYTKQVLIDGQEQTITQLRAETRTRSEPYLLSATI